MTSYRFGKFSFLAKVSGCDGRKDFINRSVGWEGAVEDTELPLEALGNVVPTSTRVDHGRHQLDVGNVGEVAWHEESVRKHRLVTLQM